METELWLRCLLPFISACPVTVMHTFAPIKQHIKKKIEGSQLQSSKQSVWVVLHQSLDYL